MGAKKKVIQIN